MRRSLAVLVLLGASAARADDGGWRTQHTATDAGINFSYGSGTDLVPNNLDFSDLKPTTAKQLLLYVFLASAYEF